VAAARSTAELLASLGHTVEEAAPAFDGEVLLEPLGRVWAAGNTASVRSVARLIGREPDGDELELTTWELDAVGRGLDAADLLEAFDALASASRAIAPFFERYDAWLTPTLAQPPLPLGVLNQSYGGGLAWWRFDLTFNPWNPVANVAGLPSISLPLAWSSSGLPIGTLLTGRFGDEATLLRLAAQLEIAQPWADRRSPVFA
jgi:amidase